AFGIANFAPPVLYAAVANLVGITGSFMTSSNTASNVLFAPLHTAVVNASPTLTNPVVLAAQTAGGAIGNVISPGNVMLGTSTTGIVGQEYAVYRVTLVYALITGVITSAVTVLLYFMA